MPEPTVPAAPSPPPPAPAPLSDSVTVVIDGEPSKAVLS